MLRDVLPEVVDVVDLAGRFDVVVDGADFGGASAYSMGLDWGMGGSLASGGCGWASGVL
ncbi:hypothetical protein QF000_003281 [Paraburkholderia atlantica]